MIRKLFVTIGLICLFLVVSSCFWKREETYFKFYISEMDMYITTFKRPGKFYLLMSPTRYETVLSDSLDYIEFKIGDEVSIALDTLNKRNILINDFYGKRKPVIHESKYNIRFVDSRTFHSLFRRSPTGKNFISMGISTDTYGIDVGGKNIKEDNLFGD